ncbi:hypothetical protein KXW38_001059, partial [Aspergillus fumigatus]
PPRRRRGLHRRPRRDGVDRPPVHLHAIRGSRARHRPARVRRLLGGRRRRHPAGQHRAPRGLPRRPRRAPARDPVRAHRTLLGDDRRLRLRRLSGAPRLARTDRMARRRRRPGRLSPPRVQPARPPSAQPARHGRRQQGSEDRRPRTLPTQSRRRRRPRHRRRRHRPC